MADRALLGMAQGAGNFIAVGTGAEGAGLGKARNGDGGEDADDDHDRHHFHHRESTGRAPQLKDSRTWMVLLFSRVVQLKF